MEQPISNKIDRLLIFFIAYTLTFFIFFETIKFTMPFILAFIFALILKYPSKLLINKLNFKPWLAALITTLVFFGILIFLIILIFTALTNEILGLKDYLQKIISDSSSGVTNLITHYQSYIFDFNIDLDPSIMETIRTNLTQSITKLINNLINFSTSVLQGTITLISYIPYLVMVIIFTLVTTYFITKLICTDNSKTYFLSILPKNNTKLLIALSQCKKMVGNYLLAYLLIIFIGFIITITGFTIFKIKYALVLSLICAFLDLLPLIGIPLIYFPLATINLISGDYFTGFGILILYAIVFVTRQIIEPKIMSSSLGINPLAVLVSLFIGLEAGGIPGVIFCMFLVISYNILKKVEIL